MKIQPDNPLPRELAPGIHWLGQCTGVQYQDRLLHGCQSVYLVCGEECSALVECGLPSDVPVIESQLEALLASGLPPLRYLFITHAELPHSGGVGHFLARYPDTIAAGDVSDLHLIFPEYADRFVRLDPGDELDLGGTCLRVVEAVFRDMPHTRWAFDTSRRALFTSDGFAFSHVHDADHCGRLGEEVTQTLDVPDGVALFALAAFHWTQHVDIEPYIARLDALLVDELDVALVAPTHGLPFSDLAVVMPEIRKGLRMGSAMNTNASVTDQALTTELT